MRKLLVLSACLVAVSFFSCSKSGGSVSGGASEGAAAKSSDRAYALRLNAGFYSIEGSAAKWLDNLSLGEALESLGPVKKGTYENREYDFLPVKRDTGKEGYILKSQLAVGGELAVVVDEAAVVYKTPKNVDALGTILPRKNILVIFPDTEKDSFVEFKAYNPTDQMYLSGRFIKTSSISTKKADVQSAILLQTAQVAKDNIRKKALLEAARDDYSDSLFAQEIAALLDPSGAAPSTSAAPETTVIAEDESAEAPEIAPLSESLAFVLNDDKVNVRENPTVSGAVITQLSKDTRVTVTEETVAEVTIAGATAKWYHITAPLDGWVFGAFLTPAD